MGQQTGYPAPSRTHSSTWAQQRDSEQGSLPWRQVGCLLLWIACFYEIWFEAGHMKGSAQQALFIFYQPVAHILAMLWLWTAIVAFFEQYAVRYDACFSTEHLKFLLSARALADLAAAFTTVLALSAAIFVICCARGNTELAAFQPTLMYGAIIIILANPFDAENESLFAPQRLFFLKTLRRVILPVQVRNSLS